MCSIWTNWYVILRRWIIRAQCHNQCLTTATWIIKTMSQKLLGQRRRAETIIQRRCMAIKYISTVAMTEIPGWMISTCWIPPVWSGASPKSADPTHQPELAILWAGSDGNSTCLEATTARSASTISISSTLTRWHGFHHKFLEPYPWPEMLTPWLSWAPSCTYLEATLETNTWRICTFSTPRLWAGPSHKFSEVHQKDWEVTPLTSSVTRFISLVAMMAVVGHSRRSFHQTICMFSIPKPWDGVIRSNLRKHLLAGKDTPLA